jgi:hypothetical protein
MRSRNVFGKGCSIRMAELFVIRESKKMKKLEMNKLNRKCRNKLKRKGRNKMNTKAIKFNYRF